MLSSGWSVSAWVPGAIAALTILARLALSWRTRIVAAWTLSLVAWIALSGLAMSVERASVPSNRVTRLIVAGRIDTSVPLRWRGRLREDPVALPWGHRFEIDLEEVEVAWANLRVGGRLRVNLYGGQRAGGRRKIGRLEIE